MQPGASHRRPAWEREAASFPLPGVPYCTVALFALFILDPFPMADAGDPSRRKDDGGATSVARREPSVEPEVQSVLCEGIPGRI
jgi:hypothetical protein